MKDVKFTIYENTLSVLLKRKEYFENELKNKTPMSIGGYDIGYRLGLIENKINEVKTEILNLTTIIR
jgi:hypothetical protein